MAVEIQHVLEPGIVAFILFLGVWINRRHMSGKDEGNWGYDQEAKYRERKFFGYRLKSRNTTRWRKTWLSRVLYKFPFLLEVWYWLLVYWTYQIGRAITAVTLQEGTIAAARLHALKLIHIEQRLGLFIEPAIQGFFLTRPAPLAVVNKIYSFIHIPGTISFLAWLYYYTPTAIYESRRRTLATCNLIAFVIFTAWPCMPPRLLPASDGFGFVDTVHVMHNSSVWTTNRFSNQLAAMPSLHFGYSFVVGITFLSTPVRSGPARSLVAGARVRDLRATLLRGLFVSFGILYPSTILLCIIATANHFVLDAVVGFFVVLVGFKMNTILLNLLPLEDAFMYLIRTHKPEPARDSEDYYTPLDIEG
ncbi:hypothetical protein OBBRIDRAFT_125010 [Obba rivulosa]|uniref:Inositolphosphotransferase Aur1/Ipt1 domain-containing protein n=1 Tax=Obba rivulosa TaxID=1052685 RepID=A0A8E2J4E1_9APHY|nr:hypothetical protein OBBRIDRAFT_125010 [Obba rivulosa]